jgi:hypothetical protein
METEPAKRYSIWLSDEQVKFLTTDLVHQFNRPEVKASENPIDVIIDVLHFCQMPKRYVRPKSDRGQGKKKGSKNKKRNSKQDMFSWDENSLAPCVGGLEDAE